MKYSRGYGLLRDEQVDDGLDIHGIVEHTFHQYDSLTVNSV